MLVSTGFIYLAILGNTLAVVNQPCVGKDGRAGEFSQDCCVHLIKNWTNISNAGVCLKTSDCSKDGGESIKGACAKDPDDVRCCTKATCTDNSKRDEIVAGGLPRHLARAAFSGNCRWSSDCAGKTQNSLCPGPGEFKCCDSNKEGFGGYGDTNDNWKGGCKAKAIKGAELIVKEFGSRVRAVGCLRDCAAGDSSDHCDGMATDLMCSDETEVSVPEQQEHIECSYINLEFG